MSQDTFLSEVELNWSQLIFGIFWGAITTAQGVSHFLVTDHVQISQYLTILLNTFYYDSGQFSFFMFVLQKNRVWHLL